HSQLKTGHPVRSAIHKQLNGRLVLRWVTTWESLLLYVLHSLLSSLLILSPPGYALTSFLFLEETNIKLDLTDCCFCRLTYELWSQAQFNLQKTDTTPRCRRSVSVPGPSNRTFHRSTPFLSYQELERA
ncbi:hypothetical protein KCV03_g9807, partial [Aureobasidium melanogenum]